MGKDELVKLEPLQSSSPEYKKVETLFMSTAGNVVSSVKKVNAIAVFILKAQQSQME